MTAFQFELQDEGPPARVMVADGVRPPFLWPGERALEIDTDATGLLFFGAPNGFWDRVFDSNRAPPAVEVVFPRIVANQAQPWWHRVHGLRAPPAASSDGPLRIAVIDEALARQGRSSCIAHVQHLGGEAWGSRSAPRAFQPSSLHGHAMCALIGSRADPTTGFPGAAPDAELYFAAAGCEGDDKVSIFRLAACIEMLVDRYRCDIISVSAGDYEMPVQSVEEAVQDAAQEGTLCFFAAGNTGEARYPASQPGCLAVAALGHAGVAPAGTSVSYTDLTQADPLSGPVYLWRKSARGPEIEFCAPGVGVIWSQNRSAAKASIGTSYACPIAAGVAARILAGSAAFRQAARSEKRHQLGLQALINACRPFGNPAEGGYWKYGRFVVP